MPLNNTQLSVQLKAEQTGAAATPDLGTLTQVTHQLLIPATVDLVNGTGAGAVDVLYSDTNTLAASATIDIDLSGALANAIGGTSVFARVKGLYIKASAANTNNVVVGAAAATQWLTLIGTATGTVILRPGAFMMVAAGVADATGYTVTAATADLLRIANSGAGTSVTYDIVVLGCSA